ncbi:MAG TPA: hypothetical protein VIX82_18905 [Solirubrobacteraceae bacterium]
MRRAIAQTRHEIPGRRALQLRLGDEVQVVGDRDPQWPEFVFVKPASARRRRPQGHSIRTRNQTVAVT